MSLALFTILFDFLSRMLAQAETRRILTGIKVSRGSPRITHLMNVDDLVIYCQANEKEAREKMKILNKYCIGTE